MLVVLMVSWGSLRLYMYMYIQVHRVYVRLAQNESTLARMRPKRNVGGFGHVHICTLS